jgi:hypothetical protein
MKIPKKIHFIWVGEKSIPTENLEYIIEFFLKYNNPTDFMYYNLFDKLKCYCPENFFADALSKNNHLNHYNFKYVFDSTIDHKNI